MSIRKFVLLSRVPMLDIQYPSVTSFARRSSTPIVPPTSESDYYQTSRRFEYLPQENGSDLGFEMDNEEMIELFNEIYGRLPRSLSKSREDAERDFFMAAYECCKNEELCHSKKGPIIPCV